MRLNHKLVSIARAPGDDGWISTFEAGTSKKTIKSKTLLLTAPAWAVAPVVGGPNGVLPEAKILEKINYPPVASVTVAYPNEAFKIIGGNSDAPIVGFGNLIPRAMKIRTLGTIWSSSLFPGRAPPGYTMLLNYIGGAQDVGIADLSKDEIVKQVDSDIR